MDEFVIKSFRANPIVSKAFCPDCGVELEKSDNMLSTFPPQYTYFCPKCGYGYTSLKSFPTIDFEIVEEMNAGSQTEDTKSEEKEDAE